MSFDALNDIIAQIKRATHNACNHYFMYCVTGDTQKANLDWFLRIHHEMVPHLFFTEKSLSHLMKIVKENDDVYQMLMNITVMTYANINAMSNGFEQLIDHLAQSADVTKSFEEALSLQPDQWKARHAPVDEIKDHLRNNRFLIVLYCIKLWMPMTDLYATKIELIRRDEGGKK